MSRDPRPDPRGSPPEEDVVLRRAPFSDNPLVGARGQRTQQRIVDAALEVFGEQGYHRGSVDRITTLAGCSRVSFYQYFSSKEDLFRHLTGQVARHLAASAEELGSVTPDADGRAELRAWVGRHTRIYERYEPVFRTFHEAAESDEVVAGGSVRVEERNVERVRTRIAEAEVPRRQLTIVLGLLSETMTGTHRTASVLRTAVPECYPAARIDEALTDVIHRTLFGRRDDVNVHTADAPSPPPLDFGPVMAEVLATEGSEAELTPSGRRTLESLLAAGQETFVRRGYHQTRVDDVVEEAGISHGAFYRYFRNKDDLAHHVTVRAIRRVSTALDDLPDLSADGDRHAALRAWLRRYYDAHAPEAALLRVWASASVTDEALRPDSAASLDWGRRRLAAFLDRRGNGDWVGDVDADAVVMLSLLGALGARQRSGAAIDAATTIIDQGLLASVA